MYGTKTYYVRNKQTGAVVNAITTAKSKDEIVLGPIYDWANYYLDENPPLSALQQYQYWNERP